MLAALMLASRIALQGIPGVHPLGLFIASFTLAYRVRALIPLYVYVLLEGIFAGFSPWWMPYLYIWLPLWGMFMLAGVFNPPRALKLPLYMLLCSLHGLSFGVLYAPAQALMFGLSFKATVAWVVAGLPFDITHGISNFFMGLLIIPLSELLMRLDGQRPQRRD
jgi:energy-coupling factor transport system substrate-specific component